MKCLMKAVSGTLYRCEKCGRTARFEHSKPSDHKLRCGVVESVPIALIGTRHDRRLTPEGERLITCKPPGDKLADFTHATGISRLAQLWTAATGLPCGCSDRQVWLNQQWHAFVWQHFSEER